MRIGINARLLIPPHVEGIGRHILEVTMHMASQHPTDSFIVFFDRRISTPIHWPQNVQTVSIPIYARHPILWHIWLHLVLPIAMYYYKIDVLYSGDGYLPLTSRVPSVLTTHDLAYLHYPEQIPFIARWDYTLFTPLYHRKAKKITAVSRAVKEDIMLHFNTLDSKIIVTGNAVNKYVFDKSTQQNPISISMDKPYFMYIGSLHPRKNIETLLSAFNTFNRLNNNQFYLVLAGRIAWNAHNIATAIKNDPNVIHTGFIHETEKQHLLFNAMGLIYISLFEGFGIPLLEAMMAQVPVITSNVSSMPEVAGDAAILVNPHDTSSIVTGLQTIATNDARRQSLIEKGRKRAIQFQWSQIAQQTYVALVDARNTESP